MDRPPSQLRVERTDETVRRSVQALITRRNLSVDQVADDVGIPLAALKRRLDNSGTAYAFTAGEVRALADYFGLESGTLCEYMDGQYQPGDNWRPMDPKPLPMNGHPSTPTHTAASANSALTRRAGAPHVGLRRGAPVKVRHRHSFTTERV